MNARLRMKLLKPTEPEPMSEPVRHKPMALAPVAFGKRDSALGGHVCNCIFTTTPRLTFKGVRVALMPAK